MRRGRYGTIWEGFWPWAKRKGLSDAGKVACCFLISTRHGDSTGAVELPAVYLAHEQGWSETRAEVIIAEVVGAGFALRRDDWLMVRDYPEHYPPMNPKHAASIISRLERLPDSIRAVCAGRWLDIDEARTSLMRHGADYVNKLAGFREVSVPNGYPIETVSIGYRDASEGVSRPLSSVSVSVSVSGSESESGSANALSTSPPEGGLALALVPVGKAPARSRRATTATARRTEWDHAREAFAAVEEAYRGYGHTLRPSDKSPHRKRIVDRLADEEPWTVPDLVLAVHGNHLEKWAQEHDQHSLEWVFRTSEQAARYADIARRHRAGETGSVAVQAQIEAYVARRMRQQGGEP